MHILSWCVFGLIVGAIARFLVPGVQRLGCIGTCLLGIGGSVVGGFLGDLLFGGGGGDFRPAGLIGSVIGGIIVLLTFRALNRQS